MAEIAYKYFSDEANFDDEANLEESEYKIVEKKPAESVVITIDGEQGAEKTTMLYKFMDAFATTGNKSIFLSLEEHKDSNLAIEKTKYLSEKAKENLDAVSKYNKPTFVFINLKSVIVFL